MVIDMSAVLSYSVIREASQTSKSMNSIIIINYNEYKVMWSYITLTIIAVVILFIFSLKTLLIL